MMPTIALGAHAGISPARNIQGSQIARSDSTVSVLTNLSMGRIVFKVHGANRARIEAKGDESPICGFNCPPQDSLEEVVELDWYFESESNSSFLASLLWADVR